MTANSLLARLHKVKRTGPNRWIARCPAHDDRTPSLAVRELEDGRVLLHCFAGCSIYDVLASVGLGFDALYPRPIDHARPERRPFNAHDVLRCAAFEATLAAVAASNLRRGVTLNDADHARLLVAAERLIAAGDIANG